jgi:hypothetical protein
MPRASAAPVAAALTLIPEVEVSPAQKGVSEKLSLAIKASEAPAVWKAKTPVVTGKLFDGAAPVT